MRSFVVLGLVLVSTLASFPATAHAVGLRGLGVKGGAAWLSTNLSFEGRDGLDEDSRLGALYGVTSEWEFRRRSAFRIVVEALYLRKGYEGTRSLDGIDAEPVDVSVNADYLSVPVLGRVLFLDDDVRVYAVFGPSLEFLLSNDDDVLLDGFESTSIAGNVGIGAEWMLSDPVRLQIEARFNTDLTNVFDGAIGDAEITEARYQMVQITAGLRY